MNHCRDCKFWEPPKDGEVFGACEGILDGGSAFTGVGAELAYTWDYEGYSSGLSTRAEFGCVGHEAKDGQA